MGFFGTGPHLIEGEQVNLHPSAARTGNGNGTVVVPVGTNHTLRLTQAVTAATAATLTVTVETSEDKTTWYAAGTFAATSTVSTQRKSFSGLDRYARVSWAVTGSITFSVTGELVG